ncbi:MAG: amino acid ABC transporter [Hyphomicrobiales bacterium]|nr:MAG: amino acid ABC transporter [Hyphomicrobiales bacterium]
MPGLTLLLRLLLLAACAAWAGAPARAAEPAIPRYWDEKEQLPKPDLSAVARVRFLTTVDFPPFNFLDKEGRLAGFHVELARALCRELDIVTRCQIQALPWDELDAAVAAGQGEALIAGTAITAATRELYAFSRPYLRFPARFAAPKASDMAEPMHAAVSGRRIGVLAGSRHEAMLRRYFPAARPVTYSRLDWLYGDLREGKLDGVFGDGMRLSFWLAGSGAGGCCRFVGGPYLAPEFLGHGLAIAVGRDDAVLAQAFDHALREIGVKGVFAELYLKYFPVGFY